MRIDIWSDVICPWCFLGKRRFDQALAQVALTQPHGLDGVEIRWRAYQLDPTATSEPGDLRRSIDAKYRPGAFDKMTARLVGLGLQEGIEYQFDIAKRVNTVDAHRLSAWAFAEAGAAGQAALVERMFVAYFEQGANVADHDTLVSLVADAGLDTVAAAAVLTERRFADEVADDLREAVERGLSGVPAFVINDEFVIPGAQDTDTFVSLLTRVASRTD